MQFSVYRHCRSIYAELRDDEALGEMLFYRRRAYQPAAPVAADYDEFIGKFAPEHDVCVFNVALGERVSYPRRAYRRTVIVGALRHGA